MDMILTDLRHLCAKSMRRLRFAILTVSLVSFILLPKPGNATSFSVQTFKPWANYAVSNGLMLKGDFNGDGRSDIFHAVTDGYANTWFANAGGATFNVASFRPWNDYAIPGGNWLVGDFNGDGKSDIFHAVNNPNGYCHVWFSLGNGNYNVTTFRPWNGYAIPNGEWLTGDFNGDGKTDIFHAVNGVSSYAHTWLSTGNGSFTVSAFRPWNGYSIPNGKWLTGDFNGDGKTDVFHAVTGTSSYAHTWLSAGNGNFEVSSFRPWNGYSIPNGNWLTGDFNGDGKTDVFHAVNGASSYAHTWLSAGNGSFNVSSFRPWNGYSIPNGEWLAGDFDGDNKTDIVHAVQSSNYANIWRSTGTGSYHVTSFSPWQGYAIPNGNWLVGDYNGDKRADIFHGVQSRDYAHLWLSTLPRVGEMSINGLEVTQAVQNLNHDVPLVSNKRTLVRVYLNYNATASASVRGVLEVYSYARSQWRTFNSINATVVNPLQNDNLRPKREDINNSLNFEMSADFTTEGWYYFRMRTLSNATTSVAFNCSDCGTSPTLLQQTPAVNMRVRVLGLRYASGSPATNFQPTTTDWTNLRSWLTRAYPTGNLNLTTNTVNASNNTQPASCNDANAQLVGIRNLDIAAGTDRRTHYYGLVHDGSGFMRGCAASIPTTANPATVASGPTGSNNWGWDNDGSYGDWYTGHELGHTYGRFHIGSGCGESSDDSNYPFPSGQISDADGGFVGLDFGGAGTTLPMRALPGTSWHDVMSYCSNQWLSSYTYMAILNRLRAENALPAAGPGLMESMIAGLGGVGDSDAPVLPMISELNKITPAYGNPTIITLGHPKKPKRLAGISRVKVAKPQSTEFVEPQAFLAAANVPDFGGEEMPAVAYFVPNKTYQVAEAMVKRPLVAETQSSLVQDTLKIGDFINVVASVNATQKTGKITSTTRLATVLAFSTENEDKGEITVRLKNAQGQILGQLQTPILYNSDLEKDEDLSGIIDASLPYKQGITTIEISFGGKVLDTRRVNANKPVAETLVSGNSLQETNSNGQKSWLLNWKAKDPDGDPLTYNIQISTDDGKSWQTIAYQIKETSFMVTKDVVEPDAKSALFKVIAFDGFNSSVVVTEMIKF